MITERKIRKLMDEHVQNMNSSFGIDEVAARLSFIAGVIAILKLLKSNDMRFMNITKYEE